MSSYLTQVAFSVHGLVLAATTSKTTTTKSNPTGFIVILALFVVLYLVFIRPQSKRRKAAMQQGTNVGVGDEVMLTSGIFGRVTSLEGDRVSVEIAPEIEIEVIRRAIGQIVSPSDAPVDVSVPPDPAGYEHEDYAHASDTDADDSTDADENDYDESDYDESANEDDSEDAGEDDSHAFGADSTADLPKGILSDGPRHDGPAGPEGRKS
jgi:preprotein translocase subunit YajC